MDADPLRCRRTDGKRWRCRLPVVPDHKYCERHLHRGRLCSRKPVEAHKTFMMSKSTASTSISLLKTTPNLLPHATIDVTKVGINNQSLKITKHSMENARRPLELAFKESVLQHDNHLGLGASSNDHKFGQPEKCRRTDGKRWRCKKDALTGTKYCVQHMHRGIRKVENVQESNPGLSFTVGASYQQMGDNVNQLNDSKSSSEATTISM